MKHFSRILAILGSFACYSASSEKVNETEIEQKPSDFAIDFAVFLGVKAYSKTDVEKNRIISENAAKGRVNDFDFQVALQPTFWKPSENFRLGMTIFLPSNWVEFSSKTNEYKKILEEEREKNPKLTNLILFTPSYDFMFGPHFDYKINKDFNLICAPCLRFFGIKNYVQKKSGENLTENLEHKIGFGLLTMLTMEMGDFFGNNKFFLSLRVYPPLKISESEKIEFSTTFCLGMGIIFLSEKNKITKQKSAILADFPRS